MTGFADLERELDAWSEAGRRATLWWRDDDAVEPTGALDRLLDLAASTAVPVALAVVPGRCSHVLGAYLGEAGNSATPLQHGYAHQNHAPAGQKKSELGAERPKSAVLEELARGAALMASIFGPRALPVLVPPWNLIAPDIVASLPGLGFRGLSTYWPRATADPVAGLRQINTHVDIMRWKDPRGFLGEADSLHLLCDHLRSRRLAASKEEREEDDLDPAEPTGLLTHHLVHDAKAWRFLERLLPLLARHPAVRLVSAGEAFAVEGAAP